MQPYQEEYIANSREYNALNIRRMPEDTSFELYSERLKGIRKRRDELVERNMELLRGNLLPTLDHLPDADEETLVELGEYAGNLLRGNDGLDVEQFCLIHRSLLGLARQRNDRRGIIRELYWLGIGRHAIYNRVSGLDGESKGSYGAQMRLCFVEAAAYLKFFDELDDFETRSYIMRSVANSALGAFATVRERTEVLKRSLRIFQDPYYREKEPGLPWDRFVRQTHQLMTSSIPHGSLRSMTHQDVSEIMESAHIIYHDRAAEAAREGKPLPAQMVFRTTAIEYFCGICDLDTFLAVMEEQMDSADAGSFSQETMYRMISLPAFYCLYLEFNRDRIPKREKYLSTLYHRIGDYMAAFPEGKEDELLFLYLRQLSATFVETAGGIPYGVFLSWMVARFAPRIYIHSVQVAAAASELCAVVLDEEPEFFDDIDFIRAISDPEEKRRAVLAYAGGCGRFHDVGKVNFMDLYARTARQWMEEESIMVRLHAASGANALAARPSTRRYAAAALGHHAWYDGSRGYPEEYKRLEHPERQMVDVIALVDWLSEITDVSKGRLGEGKTFQEAVEAAIQWEGKRFSPMLTARLRDARVADRLEEALEEGRQEAYRMLYEKGAQGAQ